MLDLFANPGFLAAGGALVSAPIIIHLINRMRFKRLRWAAMEFLLKAQKRTRKRLIIEKEQFQPKIYQNVSESKRVDEIKSDLAALKVSNLHLDLQEGLEAARK